MAKILELPTEYEEIKIKKHTLFYIEMICMWLLIVARNVLQINIPSMLILLFGTIIAISGDRDEIIALTICCLPLSTSLQYKYLLLICIIIYVFKFTKDVRITYAVFPLIFMMLWELLHGIGYSFSFYEYLRGFSELIFVTFLMMLKPRKTDFQFIVRVLVWVSIGMMLIVLANLLIESKFDLTAIFNGYYRFGKPTSGEIENYDGTFNPNSLGMICNISISCLMMLFIAHKGKLIDLIALGLLVIFGAMTMSRTFIVCFAFLIILYIFSTEKSVVKKIRTVVVLFILVISVFFIAYQIMPYIIEQYLDRFQVDDITGGRNNLFALYNEHILSSPQYLFFGLGLQDYRGKMSAIYNEAFVSSHNGIQELIVCWGLVGLFLLGWFIYRLIKDSGNNSKKLANFLPLLLLLLEIQAGQFISGGKQLLILIICFVALKTDLNNV